MPSNVMPSARADPERSRLHAIDMVRGSAIVGVALFHLVWDLDFTGLLSPGIASHALWIAFGRVLAATFMMLVGVNLVLAHSRGIRWKPFAKRIAIIALAAILISVVTYLMFPAAFVFYGILHAIVIASLIGVLLLGWPTPTVLAIALVVFSLPMLVSSPAFDSRWLAWIGFAQTPPASNDLVPIFPWLGITLVGMAITRIGLDRGWTRYLSAAPLTKPGERILTFLGRHSLIVYLIHQPVLLAIILPIANLSE